MSASRRSRMPRPSVATVSTQRIFARLSSSSSAACGLARSALLKTTMAGIFLSRNSRRMPSSNSPQPPAAAMIRPRSVRSKTWRVFCIRNSPSAPASSMPAVSMNSTGPMGRISIGFSTGSVVVPAIAETIETCCLVSALRSDDLPALRRPKRPMWRRKDLGVVVIRRTSFLASDSLFARLPQATSCPVLGTARQEMT